MAKRKVDTLKVNKYNRVFVGFCFFVASIVFSLSIISYSPLDNSLSTVSAEAVRNWLGRPGAILSDLLIQIFGLYSFVIVIALFIWGIRSLHDKIKYIKRKCTAFVLSIITGTILLTVFASSFFGEILVKKFHVPYLLGGSLGYVLTKLTFVESQLSSSVVKYVTAIVFVLFLFVLKKTLFIRFSAIQFDIRGLKKLLWPRIKRNMVNPKKDKGPESEFIPSFINTKEPIEPKEETINITNEKRIAEVMMAGSIGAYTLPSVDLLDLYQSSNKSTETADIVSERASELTSVLEEFGIKGEIINVKQGPIVTMFEFRPAPGVKTSRVISLSDDIARSMSAISTRIATIPGQNAIGIELPNKTRQTVFLRDLLSSSAFADSLTGIPIVLGKDISGLPIMADLAKMPHLLVAGTTGSGKSVSINAMILSILFRFTSDQCKLIMIDPKMLELSVYDEIPHLLTPVVTEPKKAVFALKWAVDEMENRYRQMSKLGVRNVDGFNKKLKEAKEKGDLLVRKVQTGFDQDTGRPIFETQQLDFEPMPYIVVIVDEMADLMLVAGKDIESAVQRLAQMARAAGIHLIMATQRPSVDVITGTIKANFPTRVSFQVTSKIDSRTILGEQGAEQLLGQGDMLYMQGGGRIMRVHGPFVKDSEVERIVEFVKMQGAPSYVDVICESQGDSGFGSSLNNTSDDLFGKAVEIIKTDKKVSISYIQRKLQIGYNRAARIIEEMEEKGIVSAPDHTGKRKILN